MNQYLAYTFFFFVFLFGLMLNIPVKNYGHIITVLPLVDVLDAPLTVVKGYLPGMELPATVRVILLTLLLASHNCYHSPQKTPEIIYS